MNKLRCLLFVILHGSLIALYLPFITFMLTFGGRKFHQLSFIYSSVTLFLMKTIMGISIKITGKNNLPKNQAYIIAANHQSYIDTVILLALLPKSGIIVKNELMQLPFCQIIADNSNFIPVDRTGKDRQCFRNMLKKITQLFANKFPLIIFPQGTRVAPGQDIEYNSGVHSIQKRFNLPVIPVAMMTHHCWPKNWLDKTPGVIMIDILKPIQPTLEREDFLRLLRHKIDEQLAVM